MTSRSCTPATRAIGRSCCEAGVDLYELSPTRTLHNQAARTSFPGSSLGRLHAKTAVIDQLIIFIGSMNLDPRSASTNTEFGMFIESPELARRCCASSTSASCKARTGCSSAPTATASQWLTMDGSGEVILYVEPESISCCACTTCCSVRLSRSKSSRAAMLGFNYSLADGSTRSIGALPRFA